MEEIKLLEDETLDDLQREGLRLIQKKHGFRFGMDSVLLADFARVHPGDTVADFGCGTGVLLLLLKGRGKGKKLIGVEIQKDIAEMAQRTVLLNHLEESIQIICSDIKEISGLLPSGSVDAVVCNPPYGMPGQVLRNQKEGLATARHQNADTLKDFFLAAFHVLKGRGRIFLVYPAAQMFSLMTELRRNHLEPKRFRLVYPDLEHPANLVLLEAVKDAKPRLHPMPPLIVYEKDGSFTKELKTIYHLS